MQKIVVEADPLLTEMCSILNDFEQVNKKIDQGKKQNYPLKDQRRRVTIAFNSEKEVNEIKADQRFKMSARNTLGVRTKDDWIFNLNIGNVM